MPLTDSSPTATLVKTPHASRNPDEILRMPVGALQGVPPAAETALADIGVHTVFDLATSRVFAAARRLLAASRDPQALERRLDAVPGDTIDRPPDVAVASLAEQPIAILRGIGAAHADALAAALDTPRVRDLALWPPFLAAASILDDAFFPEQQAGFDPDAPADLRPQSGTYPTERVFYRQLLIDASAAGPQGVPALEETADAIDVLPGLLSPGGFDRLATGALLTFSQSWFSVGLTLGQLLHSTSLAPGESTRMAMIDWTRRTGASASEMVSETEQLSNTETHNRALSEVTSATATELQSGTSESTVTSTTKQSGGGFGLDIGPIGFGSSSGSSTTTTDAISATSSFGLRDVSGQFAQSINDRTQQNASSARNRRASIVREVSQEEHESISTRVLTNYNHMHALTVQYYEVVQAFRVTTEVDRVERCLFVPVRLVDFRLTATVERWRSALERAALTPDIARALAEFGTVLVTTKLPWLPVFRAALTSGVTGALSLSRASAAASDTSNTAAETGGASTSTPVTPPPAPSQPLARTLIGRLTQEGWDLSQLARLGRMTGRLLLPIRTSSVYVDDHALLIGVELKSGRAGRWRILRQDGSEVLLQDVAATGVGLDAPTPLVELKAIAIENAQAVSVATTLTLQLNLFGTLTTVDVPIQLAAGGEASGLQDLVSFDGGRATRDLLDHLDANRLHYTQAILRSLDGAEIAALLARFTFRGLPLPQLVDQQPVAVSSNFLVFRTHMPAEGDAEDQRLADDLAAWRQFLRRTGLDRPVPKSEIVPLPSGGVFGEAVLGRFNAAERIDLERFWNWQDSPIPLVAPEIAAVTAGSRAQAEDLTPGQLAAPVVNIQTPTALPDPTGIAAIVTALQNGNMFRDMSGLAQTAALAQAAQTASAAGATSAMQQAAQNMQTVMDQHTQRLRIAAQLAAQLAGVPVTGVADGSSTPPGKDTVTERGGELREAGALDAKAAQSGSGSSVEADTFKAQAGAKGRQLARKVLAAAGIPLDEAALATPATTTPAARNVTPKQPAPAAVAVTLQIGTPLLDASLFPTPVQIDATISDSSGKELLRRQGPAASRVNGTLTSSDSQLSFTLAYTYDTTWPVASRVPARESLPLTLAPGATQLLIVAVILIDDRTIRVETGAPPADDAALEAVLASNGIQTRGRILGRPVVTPHAGGGFEVAFKFLRGVGLEQHRL